MKREKIVILTGAGISAESGLATFRDSDGLWNNYPVEEVASLTGFNRNPERTREFYNLLKKEVLNAKPNLAHLAITKLQTGANVTVITQNVDNLHERAGNNSIYHIHGTLDQVVCLGCGEIVTTMSAITGKSVCPACKRTGSFKPNIVFFGENLQFLSESLKAIESADYFLSVGTSGTVYPAATFVESVRNGVIKVEFNLNPGANTAKFDEHYFGKAGDLLPKWVDDFLAKK